MFADVPGYSALLFRKTYTDLSLPGALMDRAAEWLMPTPAKWNDREKTWHFPSGATLSFGYLDSAKDRFRYQGAEVQFIGFDEATQIREEDYLYLFSRLRKLRGARVPLRARAASNPGGESHEFFGDRFVTPEKPNPERIFVPAYLEDNPYLDRPSYERALAELPDLEYRQLRRGEWVRDTGEAIFKSDWFPRYTQEETYALWNSTVHRYAALDTAETVGEASAYTALTVGDIQPDWTMPIRYAARKKLEFPDLLDWVIDEVYPFIRDHKFQVLFVENASSGRQLVQQLRRSGPPWLASRVIAVKPNPGPNGKEKGWKNAALWARRGMTPLPHPSDDAPWLMPFQKELLAVPNSTFMDQADSYSLLVNGVEAASGAFSGRWHALMMDQVGSAASA